jgi:predicted dienelactone hydrolase
MKLLRRALRWSAIFGVVVIGSCTAMIPLLAWRQPNHVTLPVPTGSYAVGRVAVDWLDDSRIDAFAPNAGTKRELPVWIWYPAPRDAAQPRAEYMPARLREAMQPNPPLPLRLLLVLMTDRANVTSHALDAPPLADGTSRFPVVLLKPALGAAAAQNAVLAEDLASHGYVVVGSDSPYTTPGVAYQDGRIALRTAAGHPPETAPGRTSELAPGAPNDFYLPVVDAWVKDNRFIVDRLEQLDERDPAGRFVGRLDLGAVGAVGHSTGGAAALQFCHEDPRCRAGVDLDGAPLGDVVIGGIAKPFLFLFADRPFLDAPEPALLPDQRAFLAALDRMRAKIPSRPSLLTLRGAGHFNFFDQALLNEPTLARMFGVGAIGPIDRVRALEVMRRHVRAFFDTHLKGSPDSLLDAPSAEFSEVVFR